MQANDQPQTPPPNRPLFDERAVFNAELKPLAEQLHALCVKHKLPAVISIIYANSEECNTSMIAVCNRDGWAPPKVAMAASLLKSTNAGVGSIALPIPPCGPASLLGAIGEAFGDLAKDLGGAAAAHPYDDAIRVDTDDLKPETDETKEDAS